MSIHGKNPHKKTNKILLEPFCTFPCCSGPQKVFSPACSWNGLFWLGQHVLHATIRETSRQYITIHRSKSMCVPISKLRTGIKLLYSRLVKRHFLFTCQKFTHTNRQGSRRIELAAGLNSLQLSWLWRCPPPLQTAPLRLARKLDDPTVHSFICSFLPFSLSPPWPLLQQFPHSCPLYLHNEPKLASIPKPIIQRDIS